MRVHTKYVPGDVFGFELLNTNAVIQHSMEIIAKKGSGVILYLQPQRKGLRPAMVAYPRLEGKQQKDMKKEDASAIADYLKSIPPIKNKVE